MCWHTPDSAAWCRRITVQCQPGPGSPCHSALALLRCGFKLQKFKSILICSALLGSFWMLHDLAGGILATARMTGSSYMWRPEAWESPDRKTHMVTARSCQNELIPTVPDSSSWNGIHWFARTELYDLYWLYLSTDQLERQPYHTSHSTILKHLEWASSIQLIISIEMPRVCYRAWVLLFIT